jgi:hypothetical protein
MGFMRAVQRIFLVYTEEKGSSERASSLVCLLGNDEHLSLSHPSLPLNLSELDLERRLSSSGSCQSVTQTHARSLFP